MNGTQGSARVKEQRRVMDQASRQRRARKKLESLEQDNFHDDPHADLVRLFTIIQGRRKIEKYWAYMGEARHTSAKSWKRSWKALVETTFI